jgi:hypothetical protein
MIHIEPLHKPVAPSTHTPEDEARLFCRTWEQAIVRLRRERTALLASLRPHSGIKDHVAEYRLLKIDTEVTLYELCIDRVREQAEWRQGEPSPLREQQRERFYHLMASLAKAEIDRDDNALQVDFVSREGSENDSWSSQRWVTELETAATETLQKIVER